MGEFIFITGGARSGKSRFSAELAKKAGKDVLFIATCIPKDNEMRERVSLHKDSRPCHWKTIEEEKKIKSVLAKMKDRFDVIIIDCLGLFISNLLIRGLNEKSIQKEVESIAKMASTSNTVTIVVSNEVGEGIVPENPLARRFRDLVGLSNQIMSRYADTVYIMHAGIPVKVKLLAGSR